jgi:hypothetical protein
MKTPNLVDTFLFPFVELDIATAALSEAGLENSKGEVHKTIIATLGDELLKATYACLNFGHFLVEYCTIGVDLWWGR